MLGAPVALSYLVGVSGAGAASAQIAGFTGALDKSRAAIGRPLNMSGWLSPLAGVRSALSGIGRMAMGVLGGMGMGVGIAGFTKLIKESSTFRSDLVSLQATLKLSDDETAALASRMEELAIQTGRSRSELLAAARAGTDYGLSLSEVTDNMGDLDALARVMKVDPEMLMGGLGGLHKLAGEGVDQSTLRTMVFEGQQASGMREEPFLELVRRMAPQFGGDKRFEGQEGTALFLANIAALGDTMGEDGKKLKAGLVGFLDGLKDTTPKTVAAFKKLGITTEDARLAQTQLLGAVLGSEDGIEDLPKPLRDFLDQILSTDGGLARLESTQEGLSGDLSAQSAELQRHLDAVKNEPTWDKLMERFKAPLLGAADKVFGWVVGHMPQIQAAFQTLAVMVSYAVEKLVQFGSALVTAWKWVKDNIGEPVAEELAGGSGIMRVAKDAAMQYEYATPRERKNLEDRDRMLTSGSPAEYLLALRDVRESDNPAYEAAPRNDSVGGALNQAMSQIVQVFIDPSVAAQSEVRTSTSATPTMPSPAGVAP